MTLQPLKFLRSKLKSLGKDEQGVSAIEFALIAPFMVLLYFGGAELSLLLQADRRVTNVAATVGDLASRLPTLTDNDVADIFASSALLMSPLDPTQVRLRISSLVADQNDVVTVAWSDANANETARTTGSSVSSLPAGVVPTNGSIILAEVEYLYDSQLDLVISAQTNLTETFYLRPRRSILVNRIP